MKQNETTMIALSENGGDKKRKSGDSEDIIFEIKKSVSWIPIFTFHKLCYLRS